jgi:hypothetical protein
VQPDVQEPQSVLNQSCPRVSFGQMCKDVHGHGRDEIIGSIRREKFLRLQFLSADASLGRNVTKSDQRPPGQVVRLIFLGQVEK